MPASDREYHSLRAEDERRMAEDATDPKIAELHRQLAARHEELANRVAPKPG